MHTPRAAARFARMLVMALAWTGGSCGDSPARDEEEHTEHPSSTPRTCVHGAAAALSVVDRSLVGEPAEYVPDLTLRAREDELKSSQRARRAAAWQIVERVTRAVKLDASLLPNVHEPSMPAFQTWLGRDDIARVFSKVYGALTPAQKAERAALTPEALLQGLTWNEHAVEDFGEWTAERLLAYQEAVESDAQVSGLGGLSRVGYGTHAATHLMQRYGDLLRCMDGGSAPARTTAPSDEVIHAGEVALAVCDDRQLSAIELQPGETLRVTFEPRHGEGKIRVRSSLDHSSPAQECDAFLMGSCVVAGPARVHVQLRTEQRELSGTLHVVRTRTSDVTAPCLGQVFPSQAVMVKADWRRAGLGIELPVYDTSAERLKERLSSIEGSWTLPDGHADPGTDDIYTLQLPNGNVFRLAALHIMTKELDHWFWVTLWWSDTPDQDFGADRPSTIDARFRHYKMCTTVAFREWDATPDAGYTGAQASLGAALRVSHGGVGGPTWCSNPYLERGDHNARTNCIGCHQHGGTHVEPERILADATQYPLDGRSEVRSDFPTDYTYTTRRGDNLGAMFRAAEDAALAP